MGAGRWEAGPLDWRGDDDAAGLRPGVPVPNRVTGKSPPGPQYAAATVAHGETVAAVVLPLSPAGRDGTAGEPFPLARAGRAHAHHNPMDRFGGSGPDCSGRGWLSGSRGRSRTEVR